MIYVRFTPESGHSDRPTNMSAYDPKRTFPRSPVSVAKLLFNLIHRQAVFTARNNGKDFQLPVIALLPMIFCPHTNGTENNKRDWHAEIDKVRHQMEWASFWMAAIGKRYARQTKR